MTSQPDLLATPDEPFRRIILVPFDCISIVHRELVVEVMISFSDRNEGGDKMISRCMFIVEWGFSKPMGERIHAESRLENERKLSAMSVAVNRSNTHVVDKYQAQYRSIDDTTRKVAPC